MRMKKSLLDLLKLEGFGERCEAAKAYPFLMTAIFDVKQAMACAGALGDFWRFMEMLPPLWAADAEAYICGGVKPAAQSVEPSASPAPVVPTEQAEKPAEKKTAAANVAIPADGIPDFDSLSNVDLREFCMKNSVITRIKKECGNSKRQTMIDWCKKHFGAPTAANAAEQPSASSASPAPAEQAEKPANPYEGLSPKELYCLCKDRGLTVAEKQAAEVYIQALEIDDMRLEAAEEKRTAEEAGGVVDITAVPTEIGAGEDAGTEDVDEWDDADDVAADTAPSESGDDDWDI